MQRTNLTGAVEQLAWTTARETLREDADQQEQWLAALRALLAIRDSAEQLAAAAALSAAEHGADYPAIGAAAGMTRQGARRKWPGLAGLSESRNRKTIWWDTYGPEFVACAEAVLTAAEGDPGLPWAATLRARLAEMPDAFDHVMVDAHAVAMGATASAAVRKLAALTADAYAATNGHSALVGRAVKACASCPASAVVELLSPGGEAVPACRRHANEGLREPANRIVAAYEPGVALSVLADAHGE